MCANCKGVYHASCLKRQVEAGKEITEINKFDIFCGCNITTNEMQAYADLQKKYKNLVSKYNKMKLECEGLQNALWLKDVEISSWKTRLQSAEKGMSSKPGETLMEVDKSISTLGAANMETLLLQELNRELKDKNELLKENKKFLE